MSFGDIIRAPHFYFTLNVFVYAVLVGEVDGPFTCYLCDHLLSLLLKLHISLP